MQLVMVSQTLNAGKFTHQSSKYMRHETELWPAPQDRWQAAARNPRRGELRRRGCDGEDMSARREGGREGGTLKMDLH